VVTGFERIIIGVSDMEKAVEEYRQLTGLEETVLEASGPGSAVGFGLGNTVVQLQRVDCAAPAISALVFSHEGDGINGSSIDEALALDLRFSDGLEPTRPGGGALPTGDLSVDHLVLRTGDADACLELFCHRLGIRLALDRTVPEWGGRMLFLRAGKLTLEVIASEDVAHTAFWGVAYQCADIVATRARLVESGVSVTGIREGRKPGTRVATIKSHCLEIPTLLIGPAT
jgi:catechol 2,3-dioxygenase-like lactoylglutathione lyase family enzyme